MHTLATVAVTLAVVATLIFNASYGFTRGASFAEQAALVLVAVIIDLAKSTFLALAAQLASQGARGRAALLIVLWVPCFVLSTWAGYAFIAANRAETAATKTAAADRRARAQTRYADARRHVERITDGAVFATTAGCSQIKTKDQRAVCTAYATAEQDLATATTALAALGAAGAANPEVHLLAAATGLPPDQIEILLAFIPALLLELMASLGVYAVARPQRPPHPEAIPAPAGEELPVQMAQSPPPPTKPAQTPPSTPAPASTAARATLRPRAPTPPGGLP